MARAKKNFEESARLFTSLTGQLLSTSGTYLSTPLWHRENFREEEQVHKTHQPFGQFEHVQCRLLMHLCTFAILEYPFYLVRYEGVLEENKNSQRTD